MFITRCAFHWCELMFCFANFFFHNVACGDFFMPFWGSAIFFFYKFFHSLPPPPPQRDQLVRPQAFVRFVSLSLPQNGSLRRPLIVSLRKLSTSREVDIVHYPEMATNQIAWNSNVTTFVYANSMYSSIIGPNRLTSSRKYVVKPCRGSTLTRYDSPIIIPAK